MRPNPYVAVTGIGSAGHFLAIDKRPLGSYDLMIGVLLCSRTLRGVESSPRHVLLEEARAIAAMPRLCGVKLAAHYNINAEYKNEKDVRQDVELICELGFDAIQFNIGDKEMLKLASSIILDRQMSARLFPRPIFQVNGTLMRELGASNPYEVLPFVNAIWPDSPSQDKGAYVLMDLSGGKGVQMSVENAIKFVMESMAYDNLRVGLAGGISPDSVKSVLAGSSKSALLPRVSVDIETNARSKNDEFDVGLANSYIANARSVIVGK